MQLQRWRYIGELGRVLENWGSTKSSLNEYLEEYLVIKDQFSDLSNKAELNDFRI